MEGTKGMIKPIDREGVLDALKAIRAEAHRLEGMKPYQFASVRRLANKLGYDEILDDILEACVDGGFYLCLDHTVPINSTRSLNAGDRAEYPSQVVCEWGADQLRSRLDCVDHRLWSRPA